MSQFSEAYLVHENDVVTPPVGHVRIFKRQSTNTYWAKKSDGTIEPIASAGVNLQLAAKITETTPSIAGLLRLTVLNANIQNGAAPYTFAWEVLTSQKNTPIQFSTPGGTKTLVNPVISLGAATQIIEIDHAAAGEIANGLIACKVTDANGEVTYAYYEVWVAEAQV